ncbi:MAG: PKD domain-containing protein [Candidatus Micrarchaeota archaeon]|nr:PKD domain-containing protein [Candidatus Micrarchaeota archaeon]
MIKKPAGSAVHVLPSARTLVFALILVAALAAYSNSATYYVTPFGSGSKTGADWNNAYAGFGTGAGQANPASLTRGATYYVAGGGSYPGVIFSTPTSGSNYVTIRGATATSHGTDTGWSNAYSVSSADGGSQAIWTSPIELATSYWVFDGSTPTGTLWDQNPSDYGFRFSDGLCYDVVIGDNTGIRTNYRLGHFSGVAFAGDPGNDICPYSEKIYLLTYPLNTYEVDNVTINDTLAIGWQNAVAISSNGKPMKNWVIEYNVFLNGTHYNDAHGEDVSENYGYTQNTTIAYNLFKGRIQGTACIAVTLNYNSINTYVYGNVFSHDNIGNGVIAIGSKGLSATNLYIYNNAFDSITSGAWIGLAASGYNFYNSIAENNMLYKTAAAQLSGFTIDYNAYFSAIGTGTDPHIQTGSGDPFVNDAADNYPLKSNTNPGISLSPPYNVDPLGNARATWTRGAFEYEGSVSTSTTTTSSTSTTSTSTSTSSSSTTTSSIMPLSQPTTPRVSATSLDTGQSITFSTYVTGGLAPYSYNFTISNSMGGSIITFSGQQSFNTVSYTPSAPGSFVVKVAVTDNEPSPQTTTSGYSQTFMVNSTPSATLLTPSSNSIMLGQGITFNILISGGTGPFSLALTTSGGNVVDTVISGPGLVTFGTIFPQFNPSVYNVAGSDMGTTNPFVFASQQSSITVGNAPTSTSTTTASTSSVSLPTTSAVQQGGNNGGGTSPGGGAGSSLPTVIHSGSCYTVSNYTQRNTESFSLNGTLISSVVNFIGPTEAGVAVNGRIYENIVQGQNYTILTNSNYTYTMALLNISYLPVEDTIRLGFCSSPNANGIQRSGKSIILNVEGVVTNVSVTSNPVTTPNFGFWPGSLSMASNLTANTPIHVNITKVTSPLHGLPEGLTPIIAINITFGGYNSDSPIYITLGYNCSTNSSRLAPFILKNGSWAPILPFITNEQLCTVTFSIPPDPEVALMQNRTVLNSTVSTTSIPQQKSKAGATAYLELSMGLLIIIAAAAIWVYLKRRRMGGGIPPVEGKPQNDAGQNENPENSGSVPQGQEGSA